jgi:NADP-reducing hydrogenase subunit HndB
MEKLTVAGLARIRDAEAARSALREGGTRARITVHLGTCGTVAGAQAVLDAALDEARRRGLADVAVVSSGCAGLCGREPMATVEIAGQPPVKYVDLTPAKIREIIERHIAGGTIAAEYALAAGLETML